MDAETMHRCGDTPESIAYWQTQTVYWNGEPVQVRRPAEQFNPVNQETGD